MVVEASKPIAVVDVYEFFLSTKSRMFVSFI